MDSTVGRGGQTSPTNPSVAGTIECIEKEVHQMLDRLNHAESNIGVSHPDTGRHAQPGGAKMDPGRVDGLLQRTGNLNLLVNEINSRLGNILAALGV